MNSLFTPYWRSSENRSGWLYLLAILTMTGLTIWGTVNLNEWRNSFYTALDTHNLVAFWPLMLHFSLISVGLVVLYAFTMYFQQILCMNWRRELTLHFQERWFNNKNLTVDNPDQRIQEDISKFVTNFVNFGVNIFQTIVSLVLFSFILWSLSAVLFKIPGLLLWISIGYAIIGSGLIILLGKPLVKIEFETQKREADFRYGLAKEREADKIDNFVRLGHENRYLNLQDMLIVSFKRQKLVNFFVSGYTQIEVILPFLFIAPSFFASTLALGWLMQTAQAMNMVQQSVAFIVQNYAELAKLKATINRLTVFDKQLRG